MNNLFKEIYALSERAVTVLFGWEISTETAERIRRFDFALRHHPFHGLITTVPAYCTLTIYYDPSILYSTVMPGHSNFDKISRFLNDLVVSGHSQLKTAARVTIPVCYGGDFGPDLDLVSDSAELDIAEVIALHSLPVYQVYMIGFVPGFSYLGGMDSRLAMPRKTQPRALVAAGSVGIAGEQTGIYPLGVPGGWQIIGRTPLKMFDAARSKPSLLKAGDEVIFKPISIDQFYELSEEQHAH